MRIHHLFKYLLPASVFTAGVLLAVNSVVLHRASRDVETRDQILHEILGSAPQLDTARLEGLLGFIAEMPGPNYHAAAKRRFAALRNTVNGLRVNPLLDLGAETDLINRRLVVAKQQVFEIHDAMANLDKADNARIALTAVREIGSALNQVRQITANRAAAALQASQTTHRDLWGIQRVLIVLLAAIVSVILYGFYKRIQSLEMETKRAGLHVEKANAQLRRDIATGLMTRTSLVEKLPGLQSTLGPGQQIHLIHLQLFIPWTGGGADHAAVRDSILVAIADRIHNQLEFGHSAGYLASSENNCFFIALISNSEDRKAPMEFAERLRSQIHRPVTVKSGTYPVTSMSGIARLETEDAEPGVSLQNAELATAEEARTGRRHIGLYQPALRAVCERRSAIEQALLHALDQEECLPHFQPQFELATGRIVGVEALARWYHPNLGWIAPAEIIPIAEGNGLIIPLERKILETACAQVQLLPDDIDLAVNLSVPHILNGDVPAMVEDCLGRTGLEPNRLKLEISAGALPPIFDQVRGSLEALKDLGVRLSLDNFGTPSAALAGVLQHSWDEVKIETSLTGAVSDTVTGSSLMTMALTMVRSLGCKPLIEGIETLDQRDMLTALGCPVGQGYLFGGPMAIDDLKALFFTDQRNIAQLLA